MIIGIDARSLKNNKKNGIAIYTEEIIKKINEEKIKNIKFILYSNKKIKIDSDLNENIILKNYNKPFGPLWLYFCLTKILKKDKVDVFWGTQHMLPKRNRHTKDIKYVLTVHDLAIHKLRTVGSWKNTIIQKLFLKRNCKNADIIIADSKATKDDIIEFFKIDKEKIKVVYLGTNFNNEYNITNEEEKRILEKFKVEDKNYLFFVSTIEPRKNIVTIIKAFEELKEKEENKSLKLILAGGLGWKYKNVITAIENSKFKEDINLAGYISDKEKECLFHNTKCFVYPSLYEGFGLPILEGMQRGTIVVTSNISSMPEIGEKAAFYLNDLQNEKELADLINKVLNLEEESRKQIIEEGYNQVKKFTWEKCANQILNILIEER